VAPRRRPSRTFEDDEALRWLDLRRRYVVTVLDAKAAPSAGTP
jgi:hypothetical protein